MGRFVVGDGMQLVILPPSRTLVSNIFRNVEVDRRRHDELLAQMQRVRGRIYAADGAIRPQELTADGRHKVPVDELSWHVLSLDGDGRVCACLRYLEEKSARGFDDLWVRHSALAHSQTLGWKFRRAVEAEMVRARQLQLGFGEVGGWAVAEERRGTLEPLRIILATYGLLELLGGCAGIATATFRHCSAAILRRIGLASLLTGGAELPPYYDPRYGCKMQVLRFDSRFPNPKYRDWVVQLSSLLTTAPVICRAAGRERFHEAFSGFRVPTLEPAFHSQLVPIA
jgi:hypothetical protein